MSKEPTTFVLFGATGDLARSKIVPALCAAFARGGLGGGARVIAFSRRPWSDSEYRAFIKPSLASFSSAEADTFLRQVSYVQGTFDDAAAFAALKEKMGPGQAVYQLAVQPEFYHVIIKNLAQAHLAGKVLIEKPFGHDRASAQALDADIEKYFSPERIFYVDHYLGKEGLDAFIRSRKEDSAFERSLTREHVARITCRIDDTRDISGRGEFYDATGALMDVGQSHALQMLAAALMELPASEAGLPHARAAALEALVPNASAPVRGQYAGYLDEDEVAKGSQTETYFKIGAASRAPRWSGVALVLEAGKALGSKKTEIEIEYKDGARKVFDMEIPRTKDAYERLIEAAFGDDRSYFVSIGEILASWTFAEAAALRLREAPLAIYAKGSDGPAA
jgi:glucose-6-phosphate 1-dehydrogenase